MKTYDRQTDYQARWAMEDIKKSIDDLLGEKRDD